MFTVVALPEGERAPLSQVSCSLFPSTLNFLTVHGEEKHPQNMMLTPPCDLLLPPSLAVSHYPTSGKMLTGLLIVHTFNNFFLFATGSLKARSVECAQRAVSRQNLPSQLWISAAPPVSIVPSVASLINVLLAR